MSTTIIRNYTIMFVDNFLSTLLHRLLLNEVGRVGDSSLSILIYWYDCILTLRWIWFGWRVVLIIVFTLGYFDFLSAYIYLSNFFNFNFLCFIIYFNFGPCWCLVVIILLLLSFMCSIIFSVKMTAEILSIILDDFK